MRFAPYCTAFSGILHYIVPKTARKMVQMAFSWNKYPFYIIHRLTPFCIKPTFARIDFLRQGRRLVSKKGSYNVKFLTEKLTGFKVDKLISCQVNELRSWGDEGDEELRSWRVDEMRGWGNEELARWRACWFGNLWTGGWESLCADEFVSWQELSSTPYKAFSLTLYRQAELLLENSCWKAARRAYRGINKPLRRGKGTLLFACDAPMAFQRQCCFNYSPNRFVRKIRFRFT